MTDDVAAMTDTAPDNTPADPVVSSLPRGVTLPVMPRLAAADRAEDVKRLMHEVRAFHRADPGAGSHLAPAADMTPALLHPFKDPQNIRHHYPLVLLPPDSGNVEDRCRALGDLLEELADQLCDASDTHQILRDNLPRLEQAVRRQMVEQTGPVMARDIIGFCSEAMRTQLALQETADAVLSRDLERLLEVIPAESRLLSLSDDTPLHLFLHAAQMRAALQRTALRKEVVQLRQKLRDLLHIDQTKSEEGRRPEVLGETVGRHGLEHFDPAKLANILGPSRGLQPMPEHRRQRLEHVLDEMKAYLDRTDIPLVHIVHHEPAPPEWQTEDVQWHVVHKGPVCMRAAHLFDVQAEAFTRLFAAIRIARLELEDAYDPGRHDHLLEGFDWEAFSRDELLSLPPVLSVERVEHLAGEGMLCMSRLQLSGRPVATLVIVKPARSPGREDDEDPLHGYRYELAYRGITHRQSLVNQTSAARPEHLLDGFVRSLQSSRASMHVVASGLDAKGNVPKLGVWMHAGAALEGRAHPFFHYDPGRGESWARRFDLEHNPQPDRDWPEYQLACRADGEERRIALSFTFADYALLEPLYNQHFRVIPDTCVHDDLVTVDDYLTRPAREAINTVPYIWAVDGEGRMHRLVISRRLAFACRDRLSFWHTLQELAGINNEHVINAVTKERSRLQAEFDEARVQLEAVHRQELDNVRRTAAAAAMQRLAEKLLQLDLSALPTGGVQRIVQQAAASPAPTQAEDPSDAAPAEEPAADAPVDDDLPEEPWIDSILCTTCNDCINLNGQVFKYNANRQAVISDPTAGTYAQLVQAAEKCPSRCIHPGTPLDPNEPNLDELKERAKKFR
jgi:ferredoxin